MVHFLHVSYAVYCERERSSATGSSTTLPSQCQSQIGASSSSSTCGVRWIWVAGKVQAPSHAALCTVRTALWSLARLAAAQWRYSFMCVLIRARASGHKPWTGHTMLALVW